MNPQATGPHLTDDQLIARLYGLDATADRHLEACEPCSARWEAVQDLRASVAGPASVSSALLADQRRQVLARLEPLPVWHWRRGWTPALAAAALLIAAGLALYQPGETAALPPPPVAVQTSDPVWYEDSYTIQPVEPRAAAPLRELFEEEATE